MMSMRAAGPFEIKLSPEPLSGPAGHVAMETVYGSFVLQHSSTMTRGTPRQSITVVPDSGTAGLTGLAGAMTIINDEDRHAYEFDYTLPDDS